VAARLPRRPASALAALAAALALIGCRAAHDARPASAGAAADDGPLAVLRAQESAWNTGDVEAFVRAGYWRSDALTFFSGGDVTRGFDATLARYTQRYASEGAEMGRLAFGELETVWRGPDAALVRGTWQLDFAARDDVGGLFTLFLRRFDEGWRIVHDHTSAAAP
jgi:beta-aspartyl-peptidase (threonine type)